MMIDQALTDGYKVLKKNPVIFIPAFIAALLSTYISTITPPPELKSVSEVISWLLMYLPLIILLSLAGLFLHGMIIRMVYDAKRQRSSLIRAAKFVLSKYITLLLATTIYVVIIMAGFVVLIIPGVFLTIKLIFYDYAILIDNEGVTNSLKKSWKIVKGNWWNIFALLLILGIIFFVVGLVLGVISGLILLPFEILYFFVILFLLPWYLSVLTFAYLQLRK